MTSRFFQVSSGEESSDNEDTKELGNTAVTRFDNFSDSDSDGDVKRVVKSAKDKRFEELETLTEKITTLKKINDWGLIATTFDSMIKVFEKAQLHMTEDKSIPRFFIKSFAELDTFNKNVLEQKKEGTVTLNKTNNKALTAMKQKLRKMAANYKLEEQIAEYNANPDKEVVAEDSSSDDADGEEDSDDDDDDDDSDDDDDDKGGFARFLQKKKETGKQAEAPKAKLEKTEDDMSDEWSEEADSTDTDSDTPDGEITAAFFLKKEPTQAARKPKAEGSSRAPKAAAKTGDGKEKPKKAEEEKKEYELFPKDTEITLQLVEEKLIEILGMRGRKNVSRLDMEKNLLLLRECASKEEMGLGIDIRILLSVTMGAFDQVPNHAMHMSQEVWAKCISMVTELLGLMEEHNGKDGKSLIKISEDIPEGEENLIELEEDAEEGTPKKPLTLRASLAFFVERLDDELTKTLQGIDPHTTEYIEVLGKERVLVPLIERVEQVCRRQTDMAETCRVIMRRVEHTYFNKNLPNGKELMEKLCKFLYTHDSTDRIRARAMLCHVYNHALHDDWFKARDYMLMSHLQESINHSDVSTQILFNRAMVQLGICAFRNGHIKDAHSCLHDMHAVGRIKELLAQGILNQRYGEKNLEQERVDKRRMLPFHMHINLELLECVNLTCAMLLEVPNMVAHPHDHRRHTISKSFRRLYDFSERQLFLGPPENTRDHIVCGARALIVGDWRKCYELVSSVKIWALMKDHQEILKMIRSKIQEEGLRTYLFAFSKVYNSMSLVELSEMFELAESEVHSIISKMMIAEELHASWDQPTKSLMLQHAEPTRLQHLALQFSEKAATVVENNEKLMEMKTGTFSSDGGRGGHRGGRGGRGRGRGGRGRGGRNNNN